jgi:hypothetical protein
VVHAAAPGYVVEWGWNTLHATALPGKLILSNAVAVSEGQYQGLAILSGGNLVCWRGTLLGQTAGPKVAEPDDSVRLVVIGGKVLSNIVAIAAARDFGLALKKDGTLATWGVNFVPDAATNTIAIAAESAGSWVVRVDGTVFGWPANPSSSPYGQIIPAGGLSNVTGISAGSGDYTRGVALLQGGAVGEWGKKSVYDYPAPPPGLSNVISVAAGANHTLALRSDGTILGWGWNRVGEATGVPTTNAPYISSGNVSLGGGLLDQVVAVAASRGYSLALRRDGSVVAWGRMVNDLYPAFVPLGLSNVVAIAAADYCCAAITTNPIVAARFSSPPGGKAP